MLILLYRSYYSKSGHAWPENQRTGAGRRLDTYGTIIEKTTC